MASRSRSRAFALQLLYSADIHADGLLNRLSSLEQKSESERIRTAHQEKEHTYLIALASTPKDSWNAVKRDLVQKEYISRLQGAMLPLLQAQLELPEEWFHEQQLETTEEKKEYRKLLQENIEPLDAFLIVTDKDFSNLFHFFCQQTQELLEHPEYFAPRVIAHWLLREPQFEELINLEIDWNPLFETLCFLQMGILSELSARILLKRIRKEYDPSNKKERKTAKELAIGNKGKSLFIPKAAVHSLENESIGSLNESLHPAEPEELTYTDLLLQGVSRNLAQIDSFITNASKYWDIERMSIIDRNILRLGCFELVYQESIPSRVVINEAINLTKNFSGSAEFKNNQRGGGYSDGVKFVNGILDKIARDIGRADLKRKKSR